jgi:hypothetical protein
MKDKKMIPLNTLIRDDQQAYIETLINQHGTKAQAVRAIIDEHKNSKK